MATHAMIDPTAAAHHGPARCLVAIEMSGASWVVGVLRPEADKISVHTMKAGDADALIALMQEARRRSEQALGAPVAIARMRRSPHRLISGRGGPRTMVPRGLEAPSGRDPS